MSEKLYQIRDRVSLGQVDLDRLPDEIVDIPAEDLRFQVYKASGKWPNRAATRLQLHQMLWNKLPVTGGSIAAMRTELMAFIRSNADNLSLHCHGECTRHHDAIVAACYMELVQDTGIDMEGGIEELVNGD